MWKQIKSNKMVTYQLDEHPELIHIIKSGHQNTYFVIYDDAYELLSGKIFVYSKEKIEEIFDIKLEI